MKRGTYGFAIGGSAVTKCGTLQQATAAAQEALSKLKAPSGALASLYRWESGWRFIGHARRP